MEGKAVRHPERTSSKEANPPSSQEPPDQRHNDWRLGRNYVRVVHGEIGYIDMGSHHVMSDAISNRNEDAEPDKPNRLQAPPPSALNGCEYISVAQELPSWYKS